MFWGRMEISKESPETDGHLICFVVIYFSQKLRFIINCYRTLHRNSDYNGQMLCYDESVVRQIVSVSSCG